MAGRPFVHDQELRFSEVHEPVLESAFRMPSLTAVGIVGSRTMEKPRKRKPLIDKKSLLSR